MTEAMAMTNMTARPIPTAVTTFLDTPRKDRCQITRKDEIVDHAELRMMSASDINVFMSASYDLSRSSFNERQQSVPAE
jgi:hypothetical protein